MAARSTFLTKYFSLNGRLVPERTVPKETTKKIDQCFAERLITFRSFLRSRRPKKAAKADFRPNWADSGLPFGPTLGLIWHFLGGLDCNAFLIEFLSIFNRF